MKHIVVALAVLMGCAVIATAAEMPNSLTGKEKAEGWKLLFDGKSLDQWDLSTSPKTQWKAVDGAIVTDSKEGGALLSKEDFANFELKVEFRTTADLRSWKLMFPDPSTSPAWHTKTLHVGCPQAVKTADAKNGGWILAFSRVEHLEVDLHMVCHEAEISLIPFYGLSPALKSLRVTASYLPLQIFDLIHSPPPLDDLSVIIHDMFGYDSFLEEQAVTQPSSPPSFTGSSLGQG